MRSARFDLLHKRSDVTIGRTIFRISGSLRFVYESDAFQDRSGKRYFSAFFIFAQPTQQGVT